MNVIAPTCRLTNLDESISHHDVFDSLRIAAVIAVVLAHSFPLTGHEEAVVPLLGRAGANYGSLAVGAFFAMSGFLIAASWHRSQAGGRFAGKRARRILPGLVVCVLLTALVLGPIVTTAESYFNRETALYVTHNITLLRMRYALPGVFVDNPYAYAVNGSLWTLPYEALAYAVMLGLGLVGVLRRPRLVAALFVGAILVHVVVVDVGRSASGIEGGVASTGQAFYHVGALGVFFATGVLLYTFFDQLRQRRGLLLGAASLGLVIGSLTELLVAVSVSVAVIVVMVGTMSSRPARRLRAYGDPSYGAYIYAFPIQQLLASGGVTSPAVMFALAAPLSLAAGYASWHLVERWFLRRSPARRT